MFMNCVRACTALLLALPAFSAVLVDFSSFTVGSYGAFPGNANSGSADPAFDGQLMTLGIDITGDGNTSRLEVITGEPGAVLPIGGNYLAINTAGTDPGNPATVTIDFQRNGATWYAQGNTISLDVWDTNPTPSPRVILTAFDDLGNVAEVINFVPGSGDSETVTFTTTSLISRIELLDNGGDGHVIDNLQYQLQNTGVPEPGSVALVGGGLLLAGLLRRRK